MSIVEVNKIESDIFPLSKGDEVKSIHFEALRERMWVLEHPCAGNIDTTIKYGKWAGDDTHFIFVEYDQHNWAGWNPETEYHPGFPIVKYRWGSGIDQVDIFVFKGTVKGDVLSANPPVVGGKLNGLWLLSVDPNKYSHWNFNAGRSDIDASNRWIISQHGWDDPATGGEGWLYGLWKAYQELPTHTDAYEQIPYIKKTDGIHARHKPVEVKREHISTKLQTQTRRMFSDGYVGIPPNHTWWWDHFFPDTVSEYIRLNGDPIDSIQWGPDYREPKKNMSHQDRIQHLIEQNYPYAVEVNDFWKKNWQYWTFYGLNMDPDHDFGCVNPMYNYANGRGAWLPYEPPYYSTYDKGESVAHNTWFWMCIQDTPNESIEPGVHPNWEDYWVKNILYQPEYASNIPYYVQFSDYLFCCNSSAFEKVLKNIGQFDWYWDDKYPAVPWWMYQNHYHLMTQHMADPDTGHEQTAWKRWPLPRGCWRRVWRYTMNWNEDRDEKGQFRNQRSRFGKEINIDGKMVSMMWPGEMGNPPGYDEQLIWWGHANGFNYNFWWYRHVITQQLFDNIERPVGQEWLYTQHYVVVDVEELFRQAYKDSIWPERRIAERHDPQATDWVEVWNEQLGAMEWQEVPSFELHHELVNDMRNALLELKIFVQLTDITSTNYRVWADLGPFSTSLEAYRAGKNYCDDRGNAEIGKDYGNVEYVAMIVDNPPPWYTSGTIRHDTYTAKCWVEVTITKDVNQGFPAKEVGTLIFDIYAGGPDVFEDDTCSIGVPGVFSFKPDAAVSPQKRAYIGTIPVTCEQVHTGAGDEPTDWTTVCKFEIMPAEPWMDEIMFTNVSLGKDYYKASNVNVETGSDLSIAWVLDFDGYADDVFERDETNFIEV